MLGSDILTKRDKALKPKSVLHASTLTTSPSLLRGFKWLYKQQVWFDRGQTTGDGSFATAAYSVVEVTQICCIPFSCLNHKKLLFPLRWPSSCACCPSKLVVLLSLKAKPAQNALAALHSKHLPGYEIDGVHFKTYCELEQSKKLTTIILLNVAAYIPKDLSTVNLQKKCT